MSEHPSASIRRAAKRAGQDAYFLASVFAAYQNAHNIDDTALAAFLGCDPNDLPRLALCRRPRQRPADFRADIGHLAARFQLQESQLAKLIREVDTLQAIKQQSFQTQGTHRMLRAARDRDDTDADDSEE